MLQTSNYSLVLLIQLTLLAYDLFVNSFSELLRGAPVIQLVLFIIQDIAILFSVIIILLMMYNTYVFQVGLVSLLLEEIQGSADCLSSLPDPQHLPPLLGVAAVLYYYFYKRTAELMGDPRLYEDSLWLRDAFARARQ
ncbi:Transmembrane protein 138 [Collichthys lucidus]|uniref:Transmembrane protein 138 n=1 Tax=Collichthys lucidus TaxID=240159 RepID=A0A4U5UFV8_COLLU|nr:Transmembrane protein 138 [Collichthys lucidus]